MSVPSVQNFIQRCRCTWRRVRTTLCQNRECTRHAANLSRIEAPRYVCGQKVWLSTCKLPLQSTSSKLAPHFIGPFSIVKAVKLRLPHYLQCVHPVFHVACIKPAKPVIRIPSRPIPSPVLVEGSPVYRVRTLLDVQPLGRGHQYLVNWEGYGLEKRSLVPARDILDRSLIEDFLRSRQSSTSGRGRGRGTVMSRV